MEPGAIGAVCHYIHLNPVRARLVEVGALPSYPWSSMQALARNCPRPAWLSVAEVLDHAGGLKDTPSGRKRYFAYLDWLQQDDEAKKALAFERMSKDWAVGTVAFRKDLLKEHKVFERALERKDQSAREVREAHWSETLTRLLAAIGNHQRKSPRPRREVRGRSQSPLR